MVMAVTISCELRKIVSARSTVTTVSIVGAGLIDAARRARSAADRADRA